MSYTLPVGRPPLWRRSLPWILRFALLGVLVWAGFAVMEQGLFSVQRILVERVGPHGEPHSGAVRTSNLELRHLADVERGQPLWSVDVDRAMEGVLQHPWVRSARVRCMWTDAVVIEVQEYEPVMLLQHRGLYYVDAGGEVFKRARGGDLDYPVLTGLDPALADRNGAVARRVVREALAVLQAATESQELSSEEISEIRFHTTDGFTLLLRNLTEIRLGFSDPRRCFERLARLRRAGLPPDVPRTIDLSPRRVAVVTPQQAAGTER